MCSILFQIAIPIVPTIRVIVTFTKFEELQPLDEFATPPSSPTQFQDAKSKELEGSGSWYSWVKGVRGGQYSDSSDDRNWKDEVDPFHIPSEYTWVDAAEKKRRMRAKKAKSKRGTTRKQSSKNTSEAGHQPMMDGFE
jgi:ankyrin repeat domain-containing protein 13